MTCARNDRGAEAQCLAKQNLKKLGQRHIQITGNVFENGTQGAGLERCMGRNGDVVLLALESGVEAYMTAVCRLIT